MLVNGQNYLQVKNSHTLQKVFGGDWTVSFALLLAAKPNGVHSYFFEKGAQH